MRSFTKGLVMGSVVTVAVLTGYAYGTANGGENQANYTNPQDGHRCKVQVGYGRITGGTECRFDKVMVGYRDNYVLCADVTVTCEETP